MKSLQRLLSHPAAYLVSNLASWIHVGKVLSVSVEASCCGQLLSSFEAAMRFNGLERTQCASYLIVGPASHGLSLLLFSSHVFANESS
jgi:hypothetical protein